MSGAARDSPTAKRYSGRVVALSVAAVLITGVTTAVTLWHLGKDPKGPILAVAGIDAESAVALQRGYEDHGYVHIVGMDTDSDVGWSQALFGLQEPIALAVGSGRALVRVTEARGNPALHAFDVENGHHLWSIEPARQGEPIAPPLPPLHVRDVVWEISDRDPMSVSVISLDGELIGRVDLQPSESPDAFLVDAGLALSTAEGWVLVASDGSASPLESAPTPPDRATRPGELCPPSHVEGATWSCLATDVFVR